MRGSALLITLILMAVITGAGIAGMAARMLQERIAGSLQARTQVFAVTAAALRRCESRVRDDESEATGAASDAVIARFNRGLNKASVNAESAEYFVPTGIGDQLAAVGGTVYRLACLIAFNGRLDAARVGGSLRRHAGGPVVYTVRARGSRAPAHSDGYQRPSVILETRVVLRR